MIAKINDIYYVSLHMCMFYSIMKSEKLLKDVFYRNLVLKKEIFQSTVDIINDKLSVSDKIIIDLRSISAIDDRSFRSLEKLYRQNLSVVIINYNNDIRSKILNSDCKDYTHNVVIENNEIITFKNTCINTNDSAILLDILNNDDKLLISEILVKNIDKFSDAKIEYMHSSNLYCNRYINIKDLFNLNEIFCYCFYFLCKLSLRENITNYDGLICASNNGAVIASLLGIVFNMDVIYLRNLGPNIKIKDKYLLNHISSSKRYVYVFDFVCTGIEYKLVKTIVKIKNSEIQAAIGISDYLDVYRDGQNMLENDKIHTLFNVREHKEINYKISANREF